MSEGKLQIQVGEKTDAGKVRDRNEDNHCIRLAREDRPDRVRCLAAVADGMGGGPAGGRTSYTAIRILEKHFESLGKVADQTEEYLLAVMKWAFNEANQVIHQASREDEKYTGMGTTLTAAFVRDELAIIGHAGDSRAYLIRDGEIYQISDDHSLVAEQLRSGEITEEEARISPHRNIITRAVGTSPDIVPDIQKRELKAGDALFLCTDGLTDLVEDEEILTVIVNTKSIQQACDNLVELANQRGGHDNATAVGLELGQLSRHRAERKHAETTPVRSRGRARRLLVFLLVVVFLSVLAFGTYFVKQKLDARSSAKVSETVSPERDDANTEDRQD